MDRHTFVLYICFVAMIKIFAIFLSLSILVLSSSKTFILLNYSINKEYIAKNLCENRNKPEKNCCGKCYLRKQLHKVDDGATSPAGKTIPSKWNLGQVSVFVVPSEVRLVLLASCERAGNVLVNEAFITHDPIDNIFHPPLFA